MLNKREARAKRARRTRSKIRQLEMIRLCVHKTGRHVYAQITSFDGAKTLACASTLDEEVAKGLKSTSNVDAAKAVGTLVAKRALKAGIKAVAFDRSGYRYHGRIKALADAARESGLEF